MILFHQNHIQLIDIHAKIFCIIVNIFVNHKLQMKKGIKKISSFREAEKDTLNTYKKMTPAERLSHGMYLE